jgi:transaldolase/transaldolase/glucose-6-phosphate isomerase
MTKLHDLHDAGQSIWIDFIRRDMLTTGSIDDTVGDGVRGLTSNPSIFQQAIGTSDEYDAQIAQIIDVVKRADAEAVYERIAVLDIQGAADALRGVYDDSAGADGFVSLEVSPRLAHDTAGSIADARRLWAWVNRPNLMIKIPATPAGIPAIETLLAEGINVNATLMFSMTDYENVAQAYIRGVEAAEDPTRIASVASFFVSRIDNMVDAALEKVGSAEAMALRGTIAVANAKLAYQRYLELFEGEAFASARARGARPQRALWASTSTKNPEYPDTLYVDELIGKNTVNTVPPHTIGAFLDHGKIAVDAVASDVDTARAQIAALADLDIDFDAITADLQTEGVVKFAESFDDMLQTVAAKMSELS